MDDFSPDDMEESTSWAENLKKKIEFFEKEDPEYAAVLKRTTHQESVEKGLKGDWKKEGGYKFHTKWQDYPDKDDGNYLKIAVTHDSKGHDDPWNEEKSVGDASFYPPHKEEKEARWMGNPSVHEDHERKGIASSMYELAEKTSGASIRPDPDMQTPHAKKMWAQKDRKFGEGSRGGNIIGHTKTGNPIYK